MLPPLCVSPAVSGSVTGKQGTATLSGSTLTYVADSMTFGGSEEFYALVKVDGAVVLTFTTSEDAETVVVRDRKGNVVEPESISFTVDETGVKHWTVILTEESSGVYTYTLQAEYENGYAPEKPTEVTVTVAVLNIEIPADGEDSSPFSGLRGFFARLIDFLRRLLSFFKK